MEEWKEYRLGEIATFSQGIQVDIKSQFLQKEEGYIRFVRIVDYTKQGEEQPRYIQRPNDRYIVSETDLVMIRYGSQTAGKIVRGISGAIANNTFKVILNQNVALNNFVYYYLSQNSIREYFMRSQASSTMPAITFEMMGNLKVALPTLQTQQKIANILSSLDDKIEVNRRINEQLEELAQALFKSWFVDFEPFKDGDFVESELGMIPKEWKVGTLGELIEIKYGKDHKKLDDGNIPVYGSGGIMRYVNKSLFTGESVLIPRKGTLNNVMYVNRDFWTVDTMFFSKMKVPNIAIFVYLFLSKKDLASMNSGSAVPSMTVDILNRIQLVIPSDKVFEDYNNVVSSLFAQMSNNSKEITHLTTLRDTLLPKLMSGEIDVNEVEI